jgi:glycine dehydrogenase subunit 1
MRYLPLDESDRADMLAKIGVKSIDDLFADVPAAKLQKKLPALAKAQSEIAVEREIGRLAARNVAAG